MKVYWLANISKYRTEIMGWAILGVMLAHVKTICEFPDTLINKILGVLCYSVFTGGFLLLSGLGLYNSMHYDNNIKRFYRKRLQRLLVPYWIISIPYFIYTDMVVGENVSSFLGHVSTLSFWLHGNYSGMWYVSVSVVLYAIFPLYYRCIFSGNGNYNHKMVLKTLLILLMLAIAKFLLIENVYWYYEKIGIAIGGTALFVVGSLLMSRIITKKVLLSKIEIVEMAIVGGAVSFICGISGIMNILSIIILALIFPMMKDSKLQISQFVIKFFKWLGKYTLELYVVHLLCFYLLNVIFCVEHQGTHIIVGCTVALLICVPVNRIIKLVVARL